MCIQLHEIRRHTNELYLFYKRVYAMLAPHIVFDAMFD